MNTLIRVMYKVDECFTSVVFKIMTAYDHSLTKSLSKQAYQMYNMEKLKQKERDNRKRRRFQNHLCKLIKFGYCPAKSAHMS